MAKETKRWKEFLGNPYFSVNSLVGVEYPDDANGSNLYKQEAAAKKSFVEINGMKVYPNCYPVPWIRDHWSPKLSKTLKERVGY